MKELLTALLPELILATAACVLFLMGAKASRSLRLAAPVVAMLALLAAVCLVARSSRELFADASGTVRISQFALYIKLLAGAVGALLLLLQWPTDAQAHGNRSLDYGVD